MLPEEEEEGEDSQGKWKLLECENQPEWSLVINQSKQIQFTAWDPV